MATAAAAIPHLDGEIRLDGASAPDGEIRIVRDRWGTSHVRAGSVRDAFFAQGFCLGQERAWQLELFRHMAHGRAAALLNQNLVRLDRLNRRLGYGRDAAREWEAQSDDARLILQAYADGVNAAIDSGPRPLEFETLDHDMQPWSPIDSLAILKMVSANQHWQVKMANARLVERLGVDALAAVTPDVPVDGALIVPSGETWSGEEHAWSDALAALESEPGMRRNGVDGSNCWVIDGAHAADGHAIVCGDPHLPLSVPPQWYLMHIECPQFNVAGPCSPGYPGPVYYGHTDHVGWTMTHAQGDRWDVYRERITPGDAPTAEYQGEQEPMTRRDEVIEIRDGEPVTETVWETRHGPVLAGDPTIDDEVLSARFVLAEPCRDVDALLPIFTAANIDEARAGFQKYDSISGNFCLADTAGEIGYQYTGRTPKRECSLVPVPGWDGGHEWQGEVAKDQLPRQSNPASGVLFTANNRTTTPDYPHYLSFSQTPFRANRLSELLLTDRSDWTVDDMPPIQGDQTSLHARAFAAAVQALHVNDEAVEYKQMICHWDGQLSRDSAIAALYQELCEQLSQRTVRRYFDGTGRVLAGAADERRILLAQLSDGSDLMLPDGSSWADAVSESLVAAAAALRQRYGDPSEWRYDASHAINWRHNLGRDPELADTFNVGEVAVGGDDFTVNNAGTLYGRPGDHGASLRLVYSMGDLNAARVCLPPGNSGLPASPHYNDHLEEWRAVEYYPLYVDWNDINANAEYELRLS